MFKNDVLSASERFMESLETIGIFENLRIPKELLSPNMTIMTPILKSRANVLVKSRNRSDLPFRSFPGH